MKYLIITLTGWLLLGAETLAEAAHEGDFLSGTRQLIFEGKRSGEGYFSPDGKWLVFQSEREAGNPFYQIFALNLETGESHRISPGIGKTTCAFFRPGSDEILFASTHHDPDALQKQKSELDFRASGRERRYAWDYDPAMDLFVARRDGTGLRQLTKANGYDAEGAFSPDGKLIVFCSLRSAYPTNQLAPADLKRLETDPAYFGEIYLMNADGTDQRRLTQWPGYDGGPFFSPDGKRIVWRHFETNGTIADVYTMALDGSDVRRITDFGSMAWAPYYHPSGQYLIFTANKLGFANFELFLVDAEGTREPVRVTFTDGFDGLPVFSPDGRKLSWTANRGSQGASQIYLANWNHEAATAALASAPLRQKSATNAAKAWATPAAGAVLSSEPTVLSLSNDVAYLASEELGGRFTGSRGSELAAEFIAQTLRRAGLKPGGETNSFFYPFEFNSGVQIRGNGNALEVLQTNTELGGRGGGSRFVVEKDFRPLAFSSSGTVTGEVVFAGYGLSVPGKPGEGYDSYGSLEVSNKIVLALRYVPEEVEAKRRQELNRYAGLRYKAMLARERGAKAILFVTGPHSPNAGELAPLAYDSSTAGSGIIAASVTSNVVAQLLAGSGRDLAVVQASLDQENPHAEGGFAISNVMVTISTSLEHMKRSDRNVLGQLPAASASPETILVCAHYDHLGRGESGAMARKGEENSIHPGADDNGSGTAAVLALAQSFAAAQATNATLARRRLLFAFWSGEEVGVIGSSHFAERPLLPLTNIVAVVNFDMVGRLRENRLMLQGVGSSPTWRRLAEKRNVAAGFDLALQEDPYLPTDVTPFYTRGVPVLNFFTGSHDDYHRPTDTADKVNYEGLERIVTFAQGLISDLLVAEQPPAYAKVESSMRTAGSRETLRAYLGTIPDYATEVRGVKLSGVRAGSPADKAGLRGGDVIVEFAGQKIANVYDYTYALDAVKVGKAVEIVIMREGSRVVIEATPEVRK